LDLQVLLKSFNFKSLNLLFEGGRMIYNRKYLKHYPEQSRLCFKVLQTNVFDSTATYQLYSFMASFSGPINMHQAEIARRMGKSISFVQRAARELFERGFITRRYTTFKRVIYSLVPIKVQKKILSNPIYATFQRMFQKINRPKRIKKFDSTQYPSRMPASTKETTIIQVKNKKKESIDESRRRQLAQAARLGWFS
jgi:predicted transcriptional regulator